MTVLSVHTHQIETDSQGQAFSSLLPQILAEEDSQKLKGNVDF